MLLHIRHTSADTVSAPPGGSLLGVGFVGPWLAPFLLLGFFDTCLPPAYASCQPQIADLVFYRCRHTEEEIAECMAMIGDRNSLAAIHRIKGIKEETVMKWLEKASTHVKQFERLVRKKKLSRV